MRNRRANRSAAPSPLSCALGTVGAEAGSSVRTTHGEAGTPQHQKNMAAEAKKKEKEPLGVILKRAGKRALGGGVPGFAAMIIQVLALMWLRTLVNYQYSRGGTFGEAFKTLMADGGIARFYNGFWAAVIVGPLSRFGDTAANAGILAICDGVLPSASGRVGVCPCAVAGATGECVRLGSVAV